VELPPVSNPATAGLWREVSGGYVNTGIAANDLAAAITHINAAISPAGAYTLLIDQHISAAPQTLNRANHQLTIIGIGGPREIRLSENGRLFTVGAGGQANISLTLGNNITLVGRRVGGNGNANNNDVVVAVQNAARLVMLDGSRITGNTNTAAQDAAGNGAAVLVENLNTVFTMRGGAITGNAATASGTINTGGVYVRNNARFDMEGGNISGNTAVSDVHFVQNANSLTLSGTATVGNLTLSRTATANPGVTIAPGWSGTVSGLHLRGAGAIAADMATVIGWWFNAGTPVTVARGDGINPTTLGQITLGDFMSSAASENRQAISAAAAGAPNGFMLNAQGGLVARP